LGGYPVCVSLSCREPRTAGGRDGGKDGGCGVLRNEIRVEASADAEV